MIIIIAPALIYYILMKEDGVSIGWGFSITTVLLA